MICLKLGSWLASQKADKNVQLHSRSPHGERGLKWRGDPGRSPHGERGLKYEIINRQRQGQLSLSSRRAWFVIICAPSPCRSKASLSSRRAWIEMPTAPAVRPRTSSRSPHGERGLKSEYVVVRDNTDPSLSSRRAWIEICPRTAWSVGWTVALLTESVD